MRARVFSSLLQNWRNRVARYASPVIVDFFVLCFGTPRPFHRLWLRTLADHPAVFHLVTDHVDEWNALQLPNNTHALHVNLGTYFEQVAIALGLNSKEDLVSSFGDYFRNDCNGYTACGFRPLIPKMFPSLLQSPLWGWMDYDVIFSRNFFTELYEEYTKWPDRQSLFVPKGLRWEQCKVFRTGSVNLLCEEFSSTLANGGYLPSAAPLEAQFVFSRHRETPGCFARVRQEQIAVHWEYLRQWGPQRDKHNINVTLNTSRQAIHNTNSGEPVLVFIADYECKTLETRQVDGYLRSGDINIDFPKVSF
jgi:hypothetical protein